MWRSRASPIGPGVQRQMRSDESSSRMVRTPTLAREPAQRFGYSGRVRALLPHRAPLRESAAVAATVEARWFWQKTNCSGTGNDSRSTYSYGGTDLLATSPAQDSSLLEFRQALPGGLLYSGWTASPVSIGTSVFSIHHPGGYAAKYAEGRVTRIADFDLEGTSVHGMLETDWRRGLTEPGSSGAGLFLGDSGALVGVLAGGDGECLTTVTYSVLFATSILMPSSGWCLHRPSPSGLCIPCRRCPGWFLAASTASCGL